MTNPKIMLFFLAVLPQFIGHAQDISMQMAMLSRVPIVIEMVLYGSIGAFVGMFNVHFIGNRRIRIMLNYIACAVYFALAGVITLEMFADDK